ncbi:MAG: CvpA family protein [Johnsonella sp.]|nr:CvpA family protein [Johnsonella sp.]
MILDFLKENRIDLLVLLYLIGMTLYGHYRGFFKIALSMAALVLTLVLANFATPYVAEFLSEHSSLRQNIKTGINREFGLDSLEAEDYREQQETIRELDLPPQIRDILREENKEEVWKLLGVDQFKDYLGSYISGVFFRVFCYLLCFFVIRVLLQLILVFLEIFSKLPIIHGLNQIAGAFIGFLQGMGYLWILLMFVSVSLGTDWGAKMLALISGSRILAFLYRYNFLSHVLKKLFYFAL